MSASDWIFGISVGLGFAGFVSLLVGKDADGQSDEPWNDVPRDWEPDWAEEAPTLAPPADTR